MRQESALRQTNCALSQSMTQFGRNKVFGREGGGHKRSPPAPHLTLPLTRENNRHAHCARARSAPAAAPRTRCGTMCCARFSHCPSCPQPFDVPSSRCLPQLCLIQTSAAAGTGVFLGAHGSQRWGRAPNAPTPCEKDPHCIRASCQRRNYPAAPGQHRNPREQSRTGK